MPARKIGSFISVSFVLMFVLLVAVSFISSFEIYSIVGSAEELLDGNKLRTSIIEREVDHLKWEDGLYAFLNTQNAEKPDIALDERECAFGKWLRSAERTQLEIRIPELHGIFSELDEQHRRLHTSAVKICETFRHADRELPIYLLRQSIEHRKWSNLLERTPKEIQLILAQNIIADQCPMEDWLRSKKIQAHYASANAEYKRNWDQMVQGHAELHISARHILEEASQGCTIEQCTKIFFNEMFPARNKMMTYLSLVQEYELKELNKEDQADDILRAENLPSHQRIEQLLGVMRTIIDKRIVTDNIMLMQAKETRLLIIGIGILAAFLAVLLTIAIKRSIILPLHYITGKLMIRQNDEDSPSSGIATDTTQAAKAGATPGPIRGRHPLSRLRISRAGFNFLNHVRLHITRNCQLIQMFLRLRRQRDRGDCSPTPLPKEMIPLARAVEHYIEHQGRAMILQQQFIANVAHQLKNPLAGIYMQIDMISADAPNEYRTRILKLREAIHSMGHLVHQLLAFATSNPKLVDPHSLKEIHLDRIVEENASYWFDTALAKQMDIGFEIEPIVITGVSWLIREVLNNLIDNAIRYSKPGSKITVRCGQRPSGRAYLEVEDNGPGIPPSVRSQAFERFHRLEEIRDTTPHGTGLGLAIVREIVEGLHATVKITDPDTPPGTVVTVEW